MEEKKRRYAAAVSETRHRLLRLVAAAPEHLVVILADHGEAFGELGVWGHGHQLQDAELHVPLAIRIPGEIGRIHPEVIGTAEVGAWILRLQAGELAHPVSAPDGSGSAEVAGARGAAGLRAVRNADGRYLPLPAFRAGPPLELSDEEADRLRAFGYLDRPSP